MMVTDFIEELREKNIVLDFSAGKLKFSGPEQHITPEFIENLKRYKVNLIKYLWPAEFTNLMPINPDGSGIPLFLIHGDNGNYLLSNFLGPDQPVYGFFHPGSDGERIPYKNVPEMARAYLKQVLKIWPDGPFYFAGFSFGGVIAFEMALQLQAMGRNVPFLVLIDSFSPLAKEPVRWHKNIYRIIRSNILRPVKMEVIRLSRLSVCYFYLMLDRHLPEARRHFYMMEKYKTLTRRYRPSKFRGEVLLFRTSGNRSIYKYLGWETLADRIRFVPLVADHTTLFDNEESAGILQNEFADYLASVSGKIGNVNEIRQASPGF